jgi:hypothetical protein
MAIDVAGVLLFTGIGRAVHTGGLSFAGLVSTAWPFLTGLAVGYAILTARRLAVTSLAGGLLLWISTVTLGMVLRVVSDQGIAFAFVLVALGFLGLTVLGWRAFLAGWRVCRQTTGSGEG